MKRKQHGTRAPCFFKPLILKKIKKKGACKMAKKIAKSYAISDAKISFVSLVDKAANKREFLITKSEGSSAEFRTYGRILKTDTEKHFVTGIVYEPMVEDTDGNYMTEEEITKAAHWFMKNAGDADIQHCFEKAEGVEVVESYVAKSDMEIEGEPVKKGTWLMTMEISDSDVWDKIEKGEITGFSMGGKGAYSEVDVDISDPDNPVEKAGGKKGILKALTSMFGMAVVEKGAVKQKYQKSIVRDNFWTAYYSLTGCLLDIYNPETGEYEVVHDESKIKEALEDFSDIITDLLVSGEDIYKSIEKAGKKMSTQNKETLKSIHESLGAFLANFDDDDKEEKELNKSEIEKVVTDAIEKAMAAEKQNTVSIGLNGESVTIDGNVAKSGSQGATEAPEVTPEDIEKMVQAAIEKAMKPQEETLTRENVQELIEKAVEKAMEPVLKSAGLPSNLNDEGIEKGAGEEHYLHGFI